MRRDFALPDDASASGAATSARSPVIVTLFGEVSARRDGSPVRIPSRKAQAVLAYLALGDAPAASRERLCGLLWSESSEEKARASLRQTLHGLKGALARAGCDLVDAGREVVALSGEWRSDAAAILDGLASGRVDPVLLERKRLADSLLVGFDDLDPAFRVWLLVQRQSVQERLARSLEALLGRPDGAARDAAAALLNLDPTHEEACRHVMEDAAARGDVAAALAAYKRLWDLLDEEYGAEPSEQTQALVVRIKTGAPFLLQAQPQPRTASAKGPSDDHPYLIVSRFDGGGHDEQLAPLAAGLRHELIAKLVRFREWSVLDGGGPAVDITSLPGRAFSIDATLRRSGSNLALTLTIKEQPTGRYLWSESFAVAPERWFEIEASLLRRIAMAVNVHVTLERLMRTAPLQDVSLGTYERWLRSQHFVLSFDAANWSRSEDTLRAIIEVEPNFAPAFSSLAQLENGRHLAFPGRRRSPKAAQEALQLAKRAVQIDPLDSRSHLAHGWALTLNEQWDRAELSFDLALKLNENDPWTLTSAALAVAFCGKHDESVGLAEQALVLMPYPPAVHWAYQATLRFICADYTGSADAAKRAEGAISNIPGWHAAALAHLGELRRAREKANEFLELVRARWEGGSPTDAAICEWFLHAFPIRLTSDRVLLREGLAQALA